MQTRMPMAIAVFFLASVASAAEWTSDEKAVWELEETYWRFVKSGDVDAYRELWHDDFIGWPCFEWTPTGKDGVGKWVKDIRDNQWKLSYELKPLAMKSFGDVVVVHYAAEYVYDYGDGTTSGAGIWRKFTHTWMKDGDAWQIIGGMCAAQEPIKTPRTQVTSRFSPAGSRLWDKKVPALGRGFLAQFVAGARSVLKAM